MDPRPALGAAVLFHAGERAYTVDDAVAHAMLIGALDDVLAETLALAAAEDRADETGFEPAEEALQEASEAFRYDQELITAGETEEWLTSRGMTLDDFSAWLYQRACHEKYPGEPGDGSYPDDLSDRLRVNLWMTDRMAELGAALRKRVASGVEVAERDDAAIEAERRRFLAHHKLDAASLPSWLEAIRRNAPWLDESLRMETAFARLNRAAISEDARLRKLGSMRMALTRFEIDALVLPSEAAAREAVLCVTQDGESLSEVASESGYHADHSRAWIDDLPAHLAGQLQGAVEGQVIGPIESKDHFEVYQVLRKVEPELGDSAIADRIDKAISEELFDDLCARHTRSTDLASAPS